MNIRYPSPIVIPILISLAVVLACAYMAYRDFRLTQSTQKISATPPDPITHTDKQSPAQDSEHNAIHGLFGSVEESPATTAPPPTTRLQLTLKATFTHEDAHRSSAVIAKTDGASRRYGIGEELAPDVSLAAVHPGAVTLVRNGRKEQLLIPMLKAPSEKTQPQQPATTASVGPVEQPAETPREMTQAATVSSKEEPPSSEHFKKSNLRERLQALREKR